jgi:hypothetical protein
MGFKVSSGKVGGLLRPGGGVEPGSASGSVPGLALRGGGGG